MKVYIAVFALCAIAAIMTSEPCCRASEHQKSATTQRKTASPSIGAKQNNSETRDQTYTPYQGPPWWCAALKDSQWWLVIIAACTGIAIALQAREMARATGAMRSQWATMQGQLSQMERQANEMVKQTGHLEGSVAAAVENAKTAKASADTLVASERAWIQVHITKPPAVQMENPQTIARVWFWPDVINIGKTPATMLKLVVVTCEIPKPLGDYGQMPPVLPPEPFYGADEQRRAIGVEREAILPPNMGVNPVPAEFRGLEWNRAMERKSSLYVYGFVDYLDIVGRPHQTRFCYLYWIPFSPSDPNPRGFITAGNTPESYTKCT